MLSFKSGSGENMTEYVLINIYEDMVMEQVNHMSEHMEMCTCNKCLSDVCALVLNQLSPHYVTSRKGELMASLGTIKESDNRMNLTVKVMHALHLVKESPRH